MESFLESMQIELLDRRTWSTTSELAGAIFEWIEAFYNPDAIRPSATPSLIEFGHLHTASRSAA